MVNAFFSLYALTVLPRIQDVQFGKQLFEKQKLSVLIDNIDKLTAGGLAADFWIFPDAVCLLCR